jgi:ADP-ribose pyrophosphatase
MTDNLSPPEIETTGSRLVYQNRWMKVREDTIRRLHGAEGLYGVVEKPNFVMVVPVAGDGSLHMVEQYRYPVGGRFWEFPQGAWEGSPGADPLEVARGELREETGLATAEMIHAGFLFQAYGYATQGFHLFLARGLTPGEKALEVEEADLISRPVSPSELAAMICDGRVRDSGTLAAIALLRVKGLLML